MDLLSGLVDKSLVVAEAVGESGVRYRLLEPVRQYAGERLEVSGGVGEARRRHAEHFLALAEEAEPGLRGPQQAAWSGMLEREHDNLRAALSWGLERGETELELRLAGALRWFWWARGHFDEGRSWLEEALAMGGRASARARARALDGAGFFAYDLGDMGRVATAAEEGLELSARRELGGEVAANFLRMLGEAEQIRGDYGRAAELFEESLTVSRETGDEWNLAWSLLTLGNASGYLGDHERAMRLYREGLDLSRGSGDTAVVASFVHCMGRELLLHGDYEPAATLNEEAAALYRDAGQKGGLEYALNNLGWVALLRGEPERAGSSYSESLALCLELGNRMIAAESIDGMACIAGTEGAAERAARLFGAARALRESLGHRQAPRISALREGYLPAARSQLEGASWEAAWEEGRTMAFAEAVEYALSAAEPDSPVSERARTDVRTTLSRREKEVASLVGRGMTDHQIASELVVSVHTIHHHVANVLRKLNLRSREQIASHLDNR